MLQAWQSNMSILLLCPQVGALLFGLYFLNLNVMCCAEDANPWRYFALDLQVQRTYLMIAEEGLLRRTSLLSWAKRSYTFVSGSTNMPLTSMKLAPASKWTACSRQSQIRSKVQLAARWPSECLLLRTSAPCHPSRITQSSSTNKAKSASSTQGWYAHRWRRILYEQISLPFHASAIDSLNGTYLPCYQ